MKRQALLFPIVLAGCGTGSPENATAPVPAPNVPAVAEAPASKPAALVPRPADPAELDRLILAGFTPHADHLHAPGVNECPMSKGNDVVM